MSLLATKRKQTQVILHCKHALARYLNQNIILRSPSGDIDITVILIGKCIEEKDRCFIDFGGGKNRKGLWLGDIDMEVNMKECLIGFHAFTGNDYISSFFRKGKEACWKVLESNPKFCKAFQLLGDTWNLTDSVFALLEEFVCFLYGYRKKSVNFVRHQMFQKKYSKDSKIIDLALLPPCQSVLQLHAYRANFVAKIWRSSDQPQVFMPDISSYGWTGDYEIKWLSKEFPDNIEEILFDPAFGEIDDLYGRDEQTDDEEYIEN